MMTDESKNRLHATVLGRVQGVSFRYFVVEQAENLELSGWVRNLWDGAVEVTAEGERQDLETLLQKLHEGPPMAGVTGVKFNWQPYSGEFKGFHVKSNA